MFDRFERTIRRTLRKLAKQRIRMVLQPGNAWVIDRAITHDDDTQAALLTGQMRGLGRTASSCRADRSAFAKRRTTAERQFRQDGDFLPPHIGRLVSNLSVRSDCHMRIADFGDVVRVGNLWECSPSLSKH